ncbi:cytochrome p450 [Moniliophthora roreri MCA 2997]|uniref:Cytochrome p450 n=1 Tax=Moniliophthora roreri (strain MCA 2997) TaxID=1381753 RepID=V2X9U6_MONRO|nr:cytochrome p450 [Moniliophthora roreri MCA 2997]
MALSMLSYALLSLCIYIVYLSTRRTGRLPPGPKGYPIVGNTFQLDPNRPWHTFVQWKKEYGDIVHFRLFNQDVILLNSAKAAGDLLDRRAANYSQRPRSVVAEYMTGGMLLVLINIGAKWRSMRRAAHEALNVRASTRYYPMQMREGIRLAMDLLESPEHCRDHVHRFTSSEITSLLYNNPPMQSSQDPVIAFLDSFIDTVSKATSPSTYLANHTPILEYVPESLAKWKRNSKEIYEYHEERFQSYFRTIKEKFICKTSEIGPSFCATLVESHARHGLDDNSSAWLAAMLYMAGYETTASTLGWLVLAMIRFPESQGRAQEELDHVVGRTRIPTLDDMENLPYLRAVVKEALRWRSPAPMGVFHASLEDDTYEGYFIPKNSYIIPNILAMNHDTTTYGPDPDEFRPERFLNNDDGTHKLSPPDTKDEGHYSFGFGRRICPGRHLTFNALLTFAITLWAVYLEPGKDAVGREEPLCVDDEGSGILSRPPPYKVTSKPRFPEAKELLKLANEEWS